MATVYVRPSVQRPDFRLVISFLWSDLHSCDTDGDARNPASREWTELYCKNRENPAEVFEVSPTNTRPLTLRVTSDHPSLAPRVAYFLAVETEGLWSSDEGGPFRDPSELQPELAGFDLSGALDRAAASVWRRSSLANPYPNLAGEV